MMQRIVKVQLALREHRFTMRDDELGVCRERLDIDPVQQIAWNVQQRSPSLPQHRRQSCNCWHTHVVALRQFLEGRTLGSPLPCFSLLLWRELRRPICCPRAFARLRLSVVRVRIRPRY
jgi:hypothetical protein